MSEYIFKSACLFGGAGGMAMGTQQASQKYREHEGRFELCGAYDFDAYACRVYEYLTGSPEARLDATTVTTEDIRKLLGPEPPDSVWISAPCKGSSKLLSSAKAETAKYVAMNDLSYRGVLTLLDAYPESLIGLLIFENVPNITTRARKMLEALRKLLRSRGYVLHDGFHEARHIGDLAQRRKRWFMVARHPSKVPVFLYKPPHKAGKVCGDVLGPLPLPNDPAGGPMHRLSDTSMINLLRLWAIPAGGDWRDLIRDGTPRRKRFRRHHVEEWTQPSVTVGGSGSNGPCAVADPREPTPGVDLSRPTEVFDHVDRVTGWDQATGTVTAGTSSSNGAPSVADPRVPLERARPGFTSMDHVLSWDGASRTVTGATRPGNGAPSVADPRALDLLDGATPSEEERRRWEREGIKTEGQTSWFNGKYSVTPWGEPTGTVIGAGAGNGGSYVADPRVPAPVCLIPPSTRGCGRFDIFSKHHVTPWDGASKAVIAGEGNGACAVADPRLPLVDSASGWHDNVLGVVGPADVAATVTSAGRPTTGAFSYADPRVPDGSGFNKYGVLRSDEPAGTVTGEAAPSTGAFAYAAPVPPELRPQAGNRDMHWGKYVVRPWDEAAGTITGASRVGSGAPSVADPRGVDLGRPQAGGGFHEGAGPGRYGVLSQLDPATTVTRNARVGTGPFSIAAPAPPLQPVDLLPVEACYDAGYGVLHPGQPARTIAATAAVGCGAYAIAADVPEPVDLVPRGVLDNPERAARYGVLHPDQPSRTITGTTRVGCGAFSIAAEVPPAQPVDLIPAAGVDSNHAGRYGVLRADEPSRTITGTSEVGCGAYAIAADVPQPVQLGLGCEPHAGAYGVTPFDGTASTVVAHGEIDNSRVAVADPRPAAPPYVVLSYAETKRIVDGEVVVPFAVVDPARPDMPLAIVDDLKRPPFRWVEHVTEKVTKRGKVSRKVTRVRETVALVLISADGTWHRPLTTLELAILQAFPSHVGGKPLDFGGGTTSQREVIGNAVPPAVAKAMAQQMALCLLVSATVGFALGTPGSAVWVKNVRALEEQLRLEGYIVVKGRQPMNFTTGEILDDGAAIWRRAKPKKTKKHRKAARAVVAPRVSPQALASALMS